MSARHPGKKIRLGLIAILALGVAPAAHAMDLAFGFQAGMNIQNFSTNPDVGTSSQIGLVLGGHVELGLTDSLYWVPELLYIQKGISYVQPVLGQSVLINATSDELTFPILAKWKWRNATPFTPFFAAGPDLGIRVGSSTSTSVNGVAINAASFQPQFDTLDFGIDFGLGGELTLSPDVALILLGQYNYGLTNVAATPGYDWKSRGIWILFGANFPI